MRHIIAILLLMLAQAASAHEFDACNAPSESPVKELSNERVRAASVRVLNKARLTGLFALCEFPGTIPRIVLVRLPDRDVTVVFVPLYVEAFTDDALDGMFGHEFGHVPTWFAPLNGIADEKRADKQGKVWLGERPMLAFLAALKAEAHRAPKMVQPIWHAEINERIDAVLYDD